MGVIENSVVNFFWCWQYIFDLFFVVCQWIVKYCKLGFLFWFQVDYICFRNLCFYQYGVYICQCQNVWCLLCGNYCLVLQSGDLCDFFGYWGNDVSVIEIGFSCIERSLIVFDLCVNGVNLCLFYSYFCCGGVEILL